MMGDPRELRQVVWNLLVNAQQAMSRGGHLEVLGRLVDGETIEVAVQDSGDGIAAADLPKIFDPFFTTKPNGTGLGLSIVHRIVQSHGGTIGVQSRPGTGTTFTVRFPAARTAVAAGAASAINERAA
jgi:two-component system sensor histidine kinase AtoS